MREVRVLSEPYSGLWNLGRNTGTLSSDEKQISGMGQDSLQNSYSWSLFKMGARVEIWYGEFDNQAAMLTVTPESGSFSGTLSIQSVNFKGFYRIAIQGNIDPQTNKVTLRKLRVLSQPTQSTSENWVMRIAAKVASGHWVLGESQGILSLDGLQMIGKGQSPNQLPYWWSFSLEKSEWHDRYSESL
jgi:hypothetical protein